MKSNHCGYSDNAIKKEKRKIIKDDFRGDNEKVQVDMTESSNSTMHTSGMHVRGRISKGACTKVADERQREKEKEIKKGIEGETKGSGFANSPRRLGDNPVSPVHQAKLQHRREPIDTYMHPALPTA